ncbi:MAG TPA: hypothetical protein VK728_05465 [Candidatus Sulfotelmatobacter sp.]|jgi:hypothetical protein|nr:hypothetical protein [Candidatus Sulfotelmatobacter sp.]
MINLIVIVISGIVFGLLVAWWRWPAFRAWIEAPKYFMLRQENRFDAAALRYRPDANPGDPE